MNDCALCDDLGGVLVWRDARWRVVRVQDDDFPAYYRLVSEVHVAEFSDLTPAGRSQCTELLNTIEKVLRQRLQPNKINLAALGNMVPHLHWHVIARFEWDSHFPQAIWGLRQREVVPVAAARLRVDLQTLDAAVAAALAA